MKFRVAQRGFSCRVGESSHQAEGGCLACALELVKAKVEGLGVMSSSESAFFGGEKNLKKNYLKPLSRKLW